MVSMHIAGELNRNKATIVKKQASFTKRRFFLNIAKPLSSLFGIEFVNFSTKY
jgi:hypothetical protein